MKIQVIIIFLVPSTGFTATTISLYFSVKIRTTSPELLSKSFKTFSLILCLSEKEKYNSPFLFIILNISDSFS